MHTTWLHVRLRRGIEHFSSEDALSANTVVWQQGQVISSILMHYYSTKSWIFWLSHHSYLSSFPFDLSSIFVFDLQQQSSSSPLPLHLIILVSHCRLSSGVNCKASVVDDVPSMIDIERNENQSCVNKVVPLLRRRLDYQVYCTTVLHELCSCTTCLR